VAELTSGTLQCTQCAGTFPVREGVLDLVGDSGATATTRRARGGVRWYAQQGLRAVINRRRLDRNSEFVMLRSLLGSASGPIVDLGCGSGWLARRLARIEGQPQVLAFDGARASIEEATALTHEASLPVDFIRASLEAVPLQSGSAGAIVQAFSLHKAQDLRALMSEVARALRPGGRYVVGTYGSETSGAWLLMREAGWHPHSEADLMRAAGQAGLQRFERVSIPPFVFFKAERV
jgi:SAM-dependent methyltransferase